MEYPSRTNIVDETEDSSDDLHYVQSPSLAIIQDNIFELYDFLDKYMTLTIKIVNNNNDSEGKANGNSSNHREIVIDFKIVIIALLLYLQYYISSMVIRKVKYWVFNNNKHKEVNETDIGSNTSSGNTNHSYDNSSYSATARSSSSRSIATERKNDDDDNKTTSTIDQSPANNRLTLNIVKQPMYNEQYTSIMDSGLLRARGPTETSTATPRSATGKSQTFGGSSSNLNEDMNDDHSDISSINGQQQNQQLDSSIRNTPQFPFLRIKNMMQGTPSVLLPNTREPIPISSEFVEGKMMVMLRSKPEDPFFADYFNGKRRIVEIRVQCRLKRTPRGTIYFGGEIPRKMQLGLVADNLCKGVLSVIRSLAPALHASWGLETSSLNSSSSDDATPDLFELPHLVSPLHSIAERLVVTPPGQTPPPFGLNDIPESDEDLRKRISSRKSGVGVFVKDCTITFSYISVYLDVVSWKIRNLGVFNTELSEFWSEMPLIVALYDIGTDQQPNPKVHSIEQKRYYLRFEVLNTARTRDRETTQLVILPESESNNNNSAVFSTSSFATNSSTQRRDSALSGFKNSAPFSASSVGSSSPEVKTRNGPIMAQYELGKESNNRSRSNLGAAARLSILSFRNSDDEDDEEDTNESFILKTKKSSSGTNNSGTTGGDDDVTYVDQASVSYNDGFAKKKSDGFLEIGDTSDRHFRPPKEFPEKSRYIIRVPAWIEYESYKTKVQSVGFIVVVTEYIENELMNKSSNHSGLLTPPAPIKWVVVRKFEEFTQYLDPIIASNVSVKKKFFLSASKSVKKNQQLFEAQRAEIDKYCRKLPPMSIDSRQLRWLSIFSERDETLFYGASDLSSSSQMEAIPFQMKNSSASFSSLGDGSKSSFVSKLEASGQIRCIYESVVLRATWETRWRAEHALICGSLIDGAKFIVLYTSDSKSPTWVISSKVIMSIRSVFAPREAIATTSGIPNIPGVFLEIETFSRIFLLCFANAEERALFVDNFDKPVIDQHTSNSQYQRKFGADTSASIVSQSVLFNGDDPFRSAIKETRRWGQKYLVLNGRRVIFPSPLDVGCIQMYQDPCKVAERVLKVALNTTQNSKLEDLILLFDSAVELRHVNLNSSSFNNAQRAAFFLNIYHAMLLHSRILLSQPATMLGWGSFGSMISWEIGCGNNAMIFSLSMIEHTILRAATSSPLMDLGVSSVRLHPGTETDYCKKFALTEKDPRINFALNPLTLSTSPDIVVFEAEKLNQQFEQITKSFIDKFVKIDPIEKEIKLHRLFRWYRDDFSSLNSVHETIQYILPYMSTSSRQLLLDSFDSKGRTTYKIKYSSFDWTPRPYILERRTAS